MTGLLSKQAVHALKALLPMAEAPGQWRSTRELAVAQQLPEPMLEQLLLRLRRAGLLQARRGRMGGYRLARDPRAISLAQVLAALQSPEALAAERGTPGQSGPIPAGTAADQVTGALQQRLEQTVARSLEQIKLEDLLFDWRSAQASSGRHGGLLLG